MTRSPPSRRRPRARGRKTRRLGLPKKKFPGPKYKHAAAMAFFEQPPQLTDYIIGKMKLTKREGDYDGFLAAKGVPYAMRLLKQIPVGATQRWASEVRDGVLWLTQTELGTFGNTEKEPFPLDGRTWVRDVAPSGMPVRRKWTEDGGRMVCEEHELEHERGGVVSITRIEVELKDGLVTVTVTDQASGASFRELFTKCSMR